MADPPGSDSKRLQDPDMAALRAFHDEVDAQATRLAGRHRERLQCRRGCASCCVDDLTVFDIEAERIRLNHAALLKDEAPHPPGACAFLDAEGACRIYGDRPYVCRTQGLPFRWFEEAESPPVVERRDICPLNDTGVPLEEISDEDCWLLGPAEGRLAELAGQESTLAKGDSGRGSSVPTPPKRVALRSLFRRDV